MQAKRTAFTLVELLVVIGIIALLISILLPALNKARSSAQITACLSNVKQMGLAMQMYQQDYKGMLPGYLTVMQPAYVRWNPNGTPPSTLPGLLSKYTNTRPDADPQKWVLNKVFRCPALSGTFDLPDDADNNATASAAPGPAYAYEVTPWEVNANITGPNIKPFGDSATSTPPKKASSLRRSAALWAVTEYDLTMTSTMPSNQHAASSATQDYKRVGRPLHKKFRSVLFFDGHAESMTLDQPVDPSKYE